MDDKLKKIKYILENKVERSQVFSGDMDEVLSNFAERGIEISREELEELVAGFIDGGKSIGNEAELSETALVDVAGGRWGLGFFNGIGRGMLDRSSGSYDKPKGGWFYKQGYALGSGVW